MYTITKYTIQIKQPTNFAGDNFKNMYTFLWYKQIGQALATEVNSLGKDIFITVEN